MDDIMNIPDKDVRILLNRELANELKKMMDVGDTYTTIIKELVDKSKTNKKNDKKQV